MSINLEKLNLRKEIVFNLSKEKGIENQKAQVVLCMDYSGSMSDLYQSGYVQDVLERIVPIAMQFDDNKEFELYLFETGCKKHNRNVTLENVGGLINREIIGKYRMGGTNYAPPIKMIKDDYTAGKKGLFSAFKKAEPLDYPVYVIFITDGNNDDKSETESILRDISNHGVFFQFVGIGNARLDFLQKLDNLSGRFIDNANFFQVQNLQSMSDNDLYGKLLGEFPDWLKLAKQNNLIK